VRRAILALGLMLAAPVSALDLTGHGGPVSALHAHRGALVSGGFDGRAILWDLDRAAASRVERFHDGNVTAVVVLADGFASAGQDGRVARWREGQAQPVWATERGISPVASLAYGGVFLAAGFFDGQIAWIDPETGLMRLQNAHDGRVAGLAFLPDGALASVGADMRFSRWAANGVLEARAGLPDLPNGMARAGGALAVPFAEGALRLLAADGTLLPERFLTDRPLVAVAADGGAVAAAAVDGTIWLLDLPSLDRRAQIAGGQGPVWALALDGDQLFAAGAQGIIRRYDARDGASLGAKGDSLSDSALDESRGAQVWRACAICHSLEPDDHSRAGPSLHGVFGRGIAQAAGYDFSPALQEMDIVWSPQTVAELFEFGPDAYTPGSRMPDQRVSDPADRQALVEFLARFSD
jgi:cytochrome c